MANISPPSSSKSENVSLVYYCPLCENKHHPSEVKMIDENENSRLMYLKCKRCGTSVTAVVFPNPFGVSALCVVTDLTSRDVMKFKRSSAEVYTDDVLELYKVVHGKGQSFMQLLCRQ